MFTKTRIFKVQNVRALNFLASTRDFKCVLHMKKRMSVTMVSSEQHGWETVTVPAECDFNTQQAKAEVTFWYSKRGKTYSATTHIVNGSFQNFLNLS